MKSFLMLLALIATALGGLSFITSINAPVRELESLLLFIIAAVLLSAFAIVDALTDLRRTFNTTGDKLDRLGAALGTPPEITSTAEATPAGTSESYLVQLSDGVRGTFTHAQLQALLDRGIIDQRAYILPQGSTEWIRVSNLTA